MTSNPATIPDIICYTFKSENKFVFKWDIHNVNCVGCEFSDIFNSSVFVFEYCRVLKKNGTLSLLEFDGSRFTKCRITLKSQNPWEEKYLWKIKAVLFLLDEEENAYEFATLYLNEKKITHDTMILSSKSLKDYDKLSNLASRNNLTILCEIYNINVQNSISKRPQPPFQCGHELFENKKYWDVMFVVAGHEIHAHKSVLASRSNVFAAMFEHEMEETKTNKVTITDIDTEVFKEVLRYIYTDEVLNLKEMASELLAASEKYDLQNLKYMCENELANSITIENAAEKLITADLYRLENLKNYAICFINGQSNAVANTKGWKEIVNNHSHLLVKLYLNK